MVDFVKSLLSKNTIFVNNVDKDDAFEQLVEFVGILLLVAFDCVACLRIHAVKVLSVGFSSDLGDAKAH